MRIVVTGARGQLGRSLAEALEGDSPILLDRAALDLDDPEAAEAAVRAHHPEVVINTAAYNLVDRAEEDAAAAFRTNAFGPRAVARACADAGALMVHFSTDYVFGGDAVRPYGEADPPEPESVYADSKLAGEEFVRSQAPLHMVIRTCGLYGRRGEGGKGGNFVDTMLRLAAEGKKIRVVNDQTVAPTATADLAKKVAELLRSWEKSRSEELLGLYHVTQAGEVTWHGFAREIFRLRGIEADVEPIPTEAYGAKAKRPRYSILAHEHLRRLGMDDMREWRGALAEYLSAALSPRTGT